MVGYSQTTNESKERMSENRIPERWVGETVNLLDKQDDEITEGELLEVNDRGAVLRVTYSHEATEEQPAYRYRVLNFYPWTTVRFLYVYDGEPEMISEKEA